MTMEGLVSNEIVPVPPRSCPSRRSNETLSRRPSRRPRSAPRTLPRRWLDGFRRDELGALLLEDLDDLQEAEARCCRRVQAAMTAASEAETEFHDADQADSIEKDVLIATSSLVAARAALVCECIDEAQEAERHMNDWERGIIIRNRAARSIQAAIVSSAVRSLCGAVHGAESEAHAKCKQAIQMCEVGESETAEFMMHSDADRRRKNRRLSVRCREGATADREPSILAPAVCPTDKSSME